MHHNTNHWRVMHYSPRAPRNLENQGFNYFCHMLSVEENKYRRRTQQKETLSLDDPFIGLGAQSSGRHVIRSTRGVRQLVALNDRPAVVPEGVITQLRVTNNQPGKQTPTFKKKRQSNYHQWST